jgi:hypothetical protein
VAQRNDEISLSQSLENAYDEVRNASQKQGWIVTRAIRPTDLWLKGGSARVSGSGRIHVRFIAGAAGSTRASIDIRRALSDSRAEASARSLYNGLHIDFPGATKAAPDPGRRERSAVRALVTALAVITILAVVLVPLPGKDKHGNVGLPAVALNQVTLYRLEVGLVVFYAGLLLLTPAFSGMIRGRLPSEISARGAKFAEEVDQSVKIAQDGVDRQAEKSIELETQIARARLNIDQLASNAGITLVD